MPYKNGIPSDDTFRRFFRALSPNQFQELFHHWIRSIQPIIKDKIIAIDGKASRHSFDEGSAMLHMISAFATEECLVLAQEKVSDKSNEITAIPRLLEWLDLRGSTVTIDAMGCQHAIANQIIKQQGQYIFALKGKQSGLNDDVVGVFRCSKQCTTSYWKLNKLYQLG
ncbi:MAG: ISAs1 family transposase [Proteobacteria bacterium]|nr:ISAs1 family transposase [Pseudomonadota bacterium]